MLVYPIKKYLLKLAIIKVILGYMQEKNYTHVVFVVKVWLRQKMKIHTGDKQYSYEICKKTFTRSDA